MNDQHSFFLVIEGLDGSGKSEISRRLTELLRATLDDRVMLTFEPHDPSAAGLYIRRVLRKKIIVSPHTLALAFALNRSDHNERVIGPFLEQNSGPRLVLCDRYVLSSLVYNTSPDLPMQAVWELNSGARRPDLTLFLDASAEICYARMGSRGGNRELFESNLAESRAHYFEAIEFLRQRGEQVVVVDANPDLLIVINSIIDVLKSIGPRWLTLQKLMFIEATAPAVLAPPPLELDRWMHDFVERYTVPVLADVVLDDGVRRLVSNEVNNLSLDELTALMMNFLQVDRRYRFESAWPGQPIDYTIIRPGGETGGLVILQDERRWEGVMRALESEFIAPHYSIRRDSIQFVVALDPSHAGEEIMQFVPDTGSVPVEVFGRGTLIQYFTRYITRRVSAEYVAPSEPPQLSMPLPEGDALTDDWSLAAAFAASAISAEEPPPPAEAAPAPPLSRTATQEIWIAQQDYVPAPDEYLPVAGDYYQEQEDGEYYSEMLAEAGNGEELLPDPVSEPLPAVIRDLAAGEAGPDLTFEPPVMDYDTGEIMAQAEEAAAPAPEAEMPWLLAEAAEADEASFDAEEGGYHYAPPPEFELPLTPADIDTGEDLIGGNGYAPPEVAVDMEPAFPQTKWDTREDLRTINFDDDLEEGDEPTPVAYDPFAAPDQAFDFDLPAREADPLADIYSATAITQAEMDAIAALYSGLNEAVGDQTDEPDAEQEEEVG